MTININKKRIIYFLSVILFLGYLIKANTLLASIEGNSVKEVDFEKLDKHNRVFCSVDEIVIYNDLKENANIQGWAFCNTEISNEDRMINIILKSSNKDKAYAYPTMLRRRTDVVETFKDKNKIYGDMLGYAGGFSTIMMESGIYELYLYCYENEENFGLVNTGKMFKKNGAEFSEYVRTSQKTEIPKEHLSNKKTESCLDDLRVTEDGSIIIVGWAFVSDLETDIQKVYVEITDSSGKTATYDTKSVTRYDVGETFENDMYNNSGFEAIIKENEFKQGDLVIDFYIENQGHFYEARTK